MNSELQIVVVNTFLYLGLFLYCIIKLPKYNLSTFLSLLYFISSFFSLLLFTSPLYSTTFTSQGKVTIDAVLYLFVLNFFIIMPFSHISIEKIRYLSNVDLKSLFNIEKTLCVAFTILLIYGIPKNISHFFSGANLAEMRDMTYGYRDSHQGFFLFNVIHRFINATPIILLFISITNIILLKSKSRWDYYSIIIYLLSKINVLLGAISRGIVIFTVLELMVVLLFFYSYIKSKIRNRIIIWSVAIGFIVVPMFSAITASRFDDDKKDAIIGFSTLRYMGEAQLNFCTLAYPDLKKPFYGWGQFGLFRRLLGMDYDNGAGREDSGVYNTVVMKKFHYNNPTYIFHGFAGVWFFNWGKFLTPLIFALFYYLIKRIKARDQWSYPFMMITVFFASWIAKGIFYADYSYEAGNILYVYLLFLCSHLYRNGKTINLPTYRKTIKYISHD